MTATITDFDPSAAPRPSESYLPPPEIDTTMVDIAEGIAGQFDRLLEEQDVVTNHYGVAHAMRGAIIESVLGVEDPKTASFDVFTRSHVGMEEMTVAYDTFSG